MVDKTKFEKAVKDMMDAVVYELKVADVGVKAFAKAFNGKTKEAFNEAQQAIDKFKEENKKQDEDGDCCCNCEHCHCHEEKVEEEHHCDCGCGHCHCEEKVDDNKEEQ